MINDNNHSSKYIFFDFIKTELDLENPDHKLSYEILTTIENMYRNSLLQESAIKKLMNKSKELHTKINLIVQPCSTLDTAAVWDPSCNQIKIELPNSQLQSRNLEKTIYTFVDNLMWELCNSVNKYFTYQNCLSLSVIGMQSPDLSAFLNELAEYQTALEHFQIIWHIAADSKKVINSSIGFEQKILKIFSLYSSTLEIDSFRQYWLYVSYNNNSSAYNYLTHSGFYRKDSVVLNEKLSNSTLSELTFEEDDKHEKQLNKIYDEIITELKHGTFDITIVKKKYSSTLIDAASYDEDNKNNYYLESTCDQTCLRM